MAVQRTHMTVDEANRLCEGCFPEHIGVRVTEIAHGRVVAALDVEPRLMAPNGFFHGSAVIGLAETACGLGSMATLPPGRTDGFATVDLQCNFVGTARDGHLECVAEMVHGGRTTQVWDVRVVRHDGRRVALVRLTQLLLAPPEASPPPAG